MSDTMTRTWRVTEEDIEAGERFDCWKCPIARSMQREFPDFITEADPTQLSLLKEDDAGVENYVWQADTPDNADQFMADFDNDNPVEPFEITVTFKHVG